MNMTEQEILRSYRTARNKRTQLKILAELNCVSVRDIANIVGVPAPPKRVINKYLHPIVHEAGVIDGYEYDGWMDIGGESFSRSDYDLYMDSDINSLLIIGETNRETTNAITNVHSIVKRLGVVTPEIYRLKRCSKQTNKAIIRKGKIK